MRSFINIYDTVDAILKAIESKKPGEIYHVSSLEEQISIKNLVKLICKKLGCTFEDSIIDINENYGRDFNYKINSKQIRINLNGVSQIKLNEGIDQVIRMDRNSELGRNSMVT